MPFEISKLTELIYKALPLIAALVTPLIVILLHWKNLAVQRAQVQLAEKLADMANEDAENDIKNLEAKVRADEEARLHAESLAGIDPAP